jgi:hypothetical protein
MKPWDASPEFHYPQFEGTWTIHEMEPFQATIADNRGRVICRGVNKQDADAILLAVNTREGLLTALHIAHAAIKEVLP